MASRASATPKQTKQELQLVPQVAQRVEHDALLAMRAGQDVVDLVDDEHLDADGAQQPQRRLLQLDHARPGAGRRQVEGREELGIEAALARLAGHLQCQHRDPLDPGLGIEARRVVGAEALHEHGLAHAAVAVDRDRGHARCAREGDEPVQRAQGVLGTRVEHPALAQDGTDAPLRWLTQGLCGKRRQVHDGWCFAHS